jgi:hypothetical protein
MSAAASASLAPVAAVAATVLTEDLGKIFERAICLVYGTPFVGSYRYDLPCAEALAVRLAALPTHFPACTHTAIRGSPYDFTSLDGSAHLSAKTTKGDGKVCPQVIGQPSRVRFCQHFGLPEETALEGVKSYIAANLPALMARYEAHTFDCPIVYYNDAKKKTLFVRQTAPIPWSTLTLRLSHAVAGRIWNESSTVYLGETGRTAIGEFQVHAHRDCVKFRWCFEKLLAAFPGCFAITPL